MEKELKAAIKKIMKYDFYDEKEQPIEVVLKHHKTEDSLRKVFVDTVLAIMYVKDDDGELRMVDDEELQKMLGNGIVDLFERANSTPQEFTEEEVQELKKMAEEVISKQEEPEVVQDEIEEDKPKRGRGRPKKAVSEKSVKEAMQIIEDIMEEEEIEQKPVKRDSLNFDKYGFRKGSKCSFIMSLVEKNKYNFPELQRELLGKTGIDPRKIIRVVNDRGDYEITRNNDGIYFVEEK